MTEAEAVAIDAELERRGATWLPAKGQRIKLQPTGSAMTWSGEASGDVAIIGGVLMVGLLRRWGDHPPTVTMHDLACIFPE